MEILKTASDERELENELVRSLGFTQFDVIKLLRKQRHMILYCTLLASAQTGMERNKIRQQMMSDPSLHQILRQLEGTEGDRESSVNEDSSTRKKKKQSKDQDMEVDDRVVEALASCQMLDLEDMSFAQGSHFMSNRKCQLPDGSFMNRFKGYEEVHVLPLKPKPFDENEVSVTS